MRLFVGLALPDSVRQSLALLQLGIDNARWIVQSNLHLTLRFIGDVDNMQAEDIDLALSDIKCPAFQMTLDGVGHFGSGRKVRSLWVGAKHSPPLNHLHEKVESAIVRAGFPSEGRKFTPHITLARFGRRGASQVGPYMEAHNDFSLGPLPVKAFTLFQSHLSHSGANYQILNEYPLAPN